MSSWIDIQKDPKHMAREKEKARELKNSQWWKNILGKGVCHYCQKIFPGSQLTMDHIVPVSRGGKSTKSNVVPSCRECNQNKKYLTPVDILLQQLDEEKKGRS
jgi:5-methylcytosine-specific restriction protein A